MSLTIMGGKSKTVFLKGVESHKLHHEFPVATGATIKAGQTVILNTSGEVLPAANDSLTGDIIGISIHNGASDELVTVAMKAMAIVWASPNAAISAGPVATAGLNVTDSSYCSYEAAAADRTDLVGWALDDSPAADGIIRVAIL